MRADGLTVWIDPDITAHDDAGRARFVIHGRASRHLEGVSAAVPDDAFGEARVISPRRFEIELDTHEMASVTFGVPLWITLDAVGAPHPRYVVEVRARTRIGAGSGERGIQLGSELTPVLVDDAVVYRGRVTLGEGIHDVRMSATIDGDVPLVDAGDGALRFDVSFDAAARAAAARLERLHLVGWRRAGMVWRRASVALSVSEVAITHLDPAVEWPADECEEPTRACLVSRGGISGDTSECGDAWRVTRCRHRLEGAEAELAPRFVDDLRAHLAAWYAVSGDDVRLAGGATLEQAQGSVALERVEELTDPEADPWAHDLGVTRVLSHPDVVFPGSDRWWMGAYDRASGELLDIYSFE